MAMSFPNSAKRCFIGLWLAILYVFCVTIVVLCLSACLFQEKLALVSKKSSEVPLFVDDFCNSELIKNSSYIIKNYSDLTKNDLDLKKLSSDLDQIIQLMCNKEQRKLTTLADIYIRYNKWYSLNVENAGIIAKIEQQYSRKEQDLLIKIEDNIKKENEFNKTLEIVNTNELKDKRKFIEGNLQTVANKRKFLDGNLYTARKDKPKVLQDATLQEENSAQLAEIFVQIYHFEKFFGAIFKFFNSASGDTNQPVSGLSNYIRVDGFQLSNFWAYPVNILKISLILSMGILGSLIFVTIEFIKEPKGYLYKSYNMYFFRPFLGMIIALAMYVMVKSGQSILSNNGESVLSPYMISFLGIISGMLSEQAYKKIASTGKQLLNGVNDSNKQTDKK
jgi:hypothetical protein